MIHVLLSILGLLLLIFALLALTGILVIAASMRSSQISQEISQPPTYRGRKE